jgi:hypothetical protein
VGSDETAFPWGDREDDLAAKIDTTVPVSARVWNYLMGGKDYYPVDKEAGDQFAAVFPGIFDVARASRYFIARAVRFLAGEAGIRQFLDIGTGMPGHDNTHEIALQAAPDARVVYVDNDPLVLAHARALLTGTARDSTDYIAGDLNRPRAILDAAVTKLDFGQPVAIMLMNVLGHIGNPYEDHEDRTARSVVDTLKAALPSGGYLAIQDGVTTSPEAVQGEEQYNETGAAPYRLRSIEQLSRFFDGLDLIDPGFTEVGHWRPDPSPFESPAVPQWGGIARKR